MMKSTDAARPEGGGVWLSAEDAARVADLLVIALEGVEEEADQADGEPATLEAFAVDGATVTPQAFAEVLRGDVARGKAVLAGIRAQLSAGAGA